MNNTIRENKNFDWFWKMLLGASVNLVAQGLRKKTNKKNILTTAGVGALAGLTEHWTSNNVNNGRGFASGISAGTMAGAVLGIGNALVTNTNVLDESIKFSSICAITDGMLRGIKTATAKEEKNVLDQVFDWYINNTMQVRAKSKIYVWLDKKYCTNVDNLKKLIQKAFDNTIFAIGYSLEFTDALVYPTIGYDISVCLTNAAQLSKQVNYHYVDNFGTQYGACPSDGYHPIWVTPFEEQQYIIPYCVMHEIGHRIIKFSYLFFVSNKYQADIRKYKNFDHEYVENERRGHTLMEYGNLVIGNLKKEKSLDDIIARGYLNINDETLNKVILVFLYFKHLECQK